MLSRQEGLLEAVICIESESTLVNCIWLTALIAKWTTVLITNSSMACQSSLLSSAVFSVCQPSGEKRSKCAHVPSPPLYIIFSCRSWYYETSALIHSGWLKGALLFSKVEHCALDVNRVWMFRSYHVKRWSQQHSVIQQSFSGVTHCLWNYLCWIRVQPH